MPRYNELRPPLLTMALGVKPAHIWTKNRYHPCFRPKLGGASLKQAPRTSTYSRFIQSLLVQTIEQIMLQIVCSLLSIIIIFYPDLIVFSIPLPFSVSFPSKCYLKACLGLHCHRVNKPAFIYAPSANHFVWRRNSQIRSSHVFPSNNQSNIQNPTKPANPRES